MCRNVELNHVDGQVQEEQMFGPQKPVPIELPKNGVVSGPKRKQCDEIDVENNESNGKCVKLNFCEVSEQRFCALLVVAYGKVN